MDAATRTIVSSASHRQEFLDPAALVHDAVADTLVLGAHTAGDRWDGYTGYEVRVLPYE